MKASWLYSKHPLVIDTDLATVIGLNEAIVLQQMNYWLHSKSAKFIDDRYWVYNTYEQWQKDNFPFWSLNTVKRTFTKLRKENLVLAANYNKAGFDKTKWYSINQEELDRRMSLASTQNESTRDSKWDHGGTQNWSMEEPKMGQPIPETTREYTKTTTEKINSSPAKKQDEPAIPYKQIINYLNKKTGAHYKPSSELNQRLIKSRWHEGYRIEDFKKVIDNKASSWQSDKKMWKYMRPQTLFGTKFDAYLNENNLEKTQNGDDGHGGYSDLMAPDPTQDDIPDDELPF